MRAKQIPAKVIRTVRSRARAPRAGGGDEVAALRRRVAHLESEVQDLRGLNVRLAELTDIVGELLLPVAARDEERLAELLAAYGRDL